MANRKIYFLAHKPELSEAIEISFDKKKIRKTFSSIRRQFAWDKEPKLYSCEINYDNCEELPIEITES